MLVGSDEIGLAIAKSLRARGSELAAMWQASAPIRHFFLDDLLPEMEVIELSVRFPDTSKLILRSTIRERKCVGVDLAKYDSSLGDYLFAFQHADVASAVADITGLADLEPDPTLYASGISVMGEGDFLNPHIDNSHDGDGKKYRALNLLFYVSPNWTLDNGGNLELWDAQVKHKQTILSRFNRLVVMETNQTSWHSVSKLLVDAQRRCVSNYYFVQNPRDGTRSSNVTTFAGRPEEKLKRFVLKLDGIFRNAIGRAIPALRNRTKHRIREP